MDIYNNLNNLPIIDWEAGIRLAGNQRTLAEDLLQFLLKDLNATLTSIKELHNIQDYKKLLHETHKLHGAVRYCGLPRLKIILERLESDLKNNIMDDLSLHLQQLDTEIKILLEHHPTLSN
jgi:two-component system sensor histidine kinase BarA